MKIFDLTLNFLRQEKLLACTVWPSKHLWLVTTYLNKEWIQYSTVYLSYEIKIDFKYELNYKAYHISCICSNIFFFRNNVDTCLPWAVSIDCARACGRTFSAHGRRMRRGRSTRRQIPGIRARIGKNCKNDDIKELSTHNQIAVISYGRCAMGFHCLDNWKVVSHTCILVQ